MPVLVPGNGKTKTGRQRTYVRDEPPAGDTTPLTVWSDYSPDRNGIHSQSHVVHFKDVLQADAHAGFTALYGNGDIHEAPCWANVRRKFHDLHATRPQPLTSKALRGIHELYLIEAEIQCKPLEQRLSMRQIDALPLLGASPYALNLGPRLTRYRDDSAIEIDNSTADPEARGIAIGRRNYLVADADSGGDRAVAIHSLIGTAKLNGVDPVARLRNVLHNIADHPVNRVDDSPPWNWSVQLRSG